MIINFLFKHYSIAYQALALDEPFSVYYAQFDPIHIIKTLAQGNNPPLYEMLLHFWIKLFGTNEASVRFLSCVFSSVSVYYLFQIGRKFFSLKTAVLASLLFTFSNYEMYFAHEARTYALFLLLTLMSMYAYLQLIHQEEKSKFNYLYIISSALLMYSHFFGGFVLFTQVLATLLFADIRKTALKKHFKQLLFVFILYAPYVVVLIIRFTNTVQTGTWIAPISGLGPIHGFCLQLLNHSDVNYLIVAVVLWATVYLVLEKFVRPNWLKRIAQGITFFFFVYGVLVVFSWNINSTFKVLFYEYSQYILFQVFYLTVLLGFLVYVLRRKEIRLELKVLILWFFFPFFTIYFVSHSLPMFVARYMMFLTPAFYLLLAVGLSFLEKESRFKIGVLVIVVMAVTFKTNVNNDRNVKDLVTKVKELKTEKTAVVMSSKDFNLNFAYYYNRDFFTDVDPKLGVEKLDQLCATDNVFSYFKFLELSKEKLSTFNQILFVDAGGEFEGSKKFFKPYHKTNLIARDKHEFFESLEIFVYDLQPIQLDSIR